MSQALVEQLRSFKEHLRQFHDMISSQSTDKPRNSETRQTVDEPTEVRTTYENSGVCTSPHSMGMSALDRLTPKTRKRYLFPSLATFSDSDDEIPVKKVGTATLGSSSSEGIPKQRKKKAAPVMKSIAIGSPERDLVAPSKKLRFRVQSSSSSETEVLRKDFVKKPKKTRVIESSSSEEIPRKTKKTRVIESSSSEEIPRKTKKSRVIESSSSEEIPRKTKKTRVIESSSSSDIEVVRKTKRHRVIDTSSSSEEIPRKPKKTRKFIDISSSSSSSDEIISKRSKKHLDSSYSYSYSDSSEEPIPKKKRFVMSSSSSEDVIPRKRSKRVIESSSSSEEPVPKKKSWKRVLESSSSSEELPKRKVTRRVVESPPKRKPSKRSVKSSSESVPKKRVPKRVLESSSSDDEVLSKPIRKASRKWIVDSSSSSDETVFSSRKFVDSSSSSDDTQRKEKMNISIGSQTGISTKEIEKMEKEERKAKMKREIAAVLRKYHVDEMSSLTDGAGLLSSGEKRRKKSHKTKRSVNFSSRSSASSREATDEKKSPKPKKNTTRDAAQIISKSLEDISSDSDELPVFIPPVPDVLEGEASPVVKLTISSGSASSSSSSSDSDVIGFSKKQETKEKKAIQEEEYSSASDVMELLEKISPRHGQKSESGERLYFIPKLNLSEANTPEKSSVSPAKTPTMIEMSDSDDDEVKFKPNLSPDALQLLEMGSEPESEPEPEQKQEPEPEPEPEQKPEPESESEPEPEQKQEEIVAVEEESAQEEEPPQREVSPKIVKESSSSEDASPFRRIKLTSSDEEPAREEEEIENIRINAAASLSSDDEPKDQVVQQETPNQQNDTSSFDELIARAKTTVTDAKTNMEDVHRRFQDVEEEDEEVETLLRRVKEMGLEVERQNEDDDSDDQLVDDILANMEFSD